MKPVYDFSKGERGKFFQPNAELRLPIYLDSDVQTYLAELAAQKGIPLGEMVNGMLKRRIKIIEMRQVSSHRIEIFSTISQKARVGRP